MFKNWFLIQILYTSKYLSIASASFHDKNDLTQLADSLLINSPGSLSV